MKFNHLEVLEEEKRGHHNYLLCRCDCGNTKWIRKRYVVSGVTKSCNCDAYSTRFKKVLINFDRPTYESWHNMVDRCTNKRNNRYYIYGARGITVCQEWLNSYDNFYADMGKRPLGGYSIDRINVDGNYCKDNCKWSTRIEQQNNTTTNVYYEYNGEQQTLAQIARKEGVKYKSLWNSVNHNCESVSDAVARLKQVITTTYSFMGKNLTKKQWSVETGISCKTISYRLNAGWSIEEALTTPVAKGNNATLRK